MLPGWWTRCGAGNVRVANALGSGVIETAAIMPFLPGLSRHLLGEELKLPSVATWWCGQEYALDWVLEHLDQVVVKPAFPRADGAGIRREAGQSAESRSSRINCGRGHTIMWRRSRWHLSTAPVSGTTATFISAAWCCGPMC